MRLLHTLCSINCRQVKGEILFDSKEAHLTHYKLFRERKLTTTSRDERELNIQSLLPGKTYQFRVVANSNHGIGDSSESLEVRTQPEENIAGPPQNVKAYPVSHTEINVEWEPPIVTNGIISKYRIYYAEVSVSLNVTKKHMTHLQISLQVDNGVEIYADSTDTTATLSELRPYTEYAISVVPWNQNGMGDSSNELVVRTYSSTPSEPPSNVTFETTGATVSNSWSFLLKRQLFYLVLSIFSQYCYNGSHHH